MLVDKDMTGYEVVKYLGDKYDDIFAEGYACGKAAGYVGTDATLYAREYAKGYAIGYAEGIEKGRRIARFQVAKALKAMGFSINVIVEVTSLTEDEIAKI